MNPNLDSTSGTAAPLAQALAEGSNGGAARPRPPAIHRSTLPFRFTGNASDYFRIWIVNLLLTLVTLGLWSPWAKVRKRRYLYGHTWLASCNFEYHANPIAILRGRLIAAAAIGIYWLFENLLPITKTWLLLALACGAPWIIARSLAFNAANSSYRGIRFQFIGTTADMAKAIWPLAACIVGFIAINDNSLDIITNPGAFGARFGGLYLVFVLSYPYVIGRIRQRLAGLSMWGNQGFRTTMRIGSVYAIYLRALALGFAVMIVGLVVIAVIGFAAVKLLPIAGFVVVAAAGATISAAVFICVTAFTRSRLTNLTFNTTTLSDVAQLRSTLSARKLAKMYALNLIAIVATAGLLIPWAAIRLARYRVESLSAEIDSPLSSVASTVTQDYRATGEELGEMFGIDLAL